MSERALVDFAMRKTGLSRRAVQAMALRGQIPGAAKLGKLWTFDPLQLARWIRDKERECRNPAISISETVYSTPAFRWPGSSAASPLRQRIEEGRKDPRNDLCALPADLQAEVIRQCEKIEWGSGNYRCTNEGHACFTCHDRAVAALGIKRGLLLKPGCPK